MKKNPDIQNELLMISAVWAEWEHAMPFMVPDNYFADLPGKILDRVKNQVPVEATISTLLPVEKPTFSVPEGYFNALPEQIMNRIRNMETNEVDAELAGYDPILLQLRKINPFYVSEGYFEQLEAGIPGSQPGRVITLQKRKKWVRFAAAAAIAGILMLTAYFYMSDRGSETDPVLSETRLFENDSLKVSDEELASFLEENNGIPVTEYLIPAPAGQDLALLEINDQVLSDMLKDISDIGIRNYMSENPEPLTMENTDQIN